MPKPILKSDALDMKGISHGFFTKEGGVSSGIYSSLNCGFGSGDETSKVWKNREIVAELLNAKTCPVLTPYQHHSGDVIEAIKPWRPGKAPKADAIVTKIPKLVIGVLTADCAPVLFCDPEAKLIGCAHAGWRGALSGVLEATVEAMVSIGATLPNISAVVGPTIGAANYEVGAEFHKEFIGHDEGYERFFKRPTEDAKHHFDLPGFAISRLEATGIGNVSALTTCTYENESLFYSYRRNSHQNIADYGRQISAITIN